MKRLKNVCLLISLLLCLSTTIKADTIHVYLPISGPQNYCQSAGFDTFIIHKHPAYGATLWNINGIPSGSGDSLIYIPTSAGSFSIIATWAGNSFGVQLNLFLVPPPHSTFQINNGSGHLNLTNDTLWLCDPTVSISAQGLVSTDVTTFGWYASGSLITSNSLLPITTSGVYYFQADNSCATTRDTIVAVRLPVTLPVFNDTSFCNTSLSLVLDPGPGWNYAWTPGGATTQTLLVTTPGTYSVNVSNLCTVGGTASLVVDHQSYPVPDLLYLQGNAMCADSVVVLDPSPGYTYSSYMWSGGATTNSITISGLTGGGGLYNVTVSQGTCTETASVFLTYLPLPSKPALCVATVDAATGNNKLTWEVSETGIASYNIYQLTSGYTLIGNVPNVAGATTLSFYDLVTNPMASAARYKIAAVDNTCGLESDQSFYHGTIKINSNPGTGGVLDLTVTDQYVDESGTYVPTKYYILIDSLNNGNLTMKDSMNAVFNSYTVTNPVQGATYVISVQLPWACGAKTNFGQMSFSNKSMVYMSVDELQNNISIKIYPNPSKGIFNIEAKNIIRIEVLDNLGRRVLTTNNPTIDMSKQSSGIYNARVYTKAGVGNCKLVVE
ncbi:MAG: T9SS type A sorting domain-containing protein [Bacteroidetes bacterium]|nr:T9SS type A sorting domain-containing protein [Bacteroidota bacterium]